MQPSAGRRALMFFSRFSFRQGKPGLDDVVRGRLMGRHKGRVVSSATLLAIGIIAVTWYFVEQSAQLKIAVGPAGSPDVEIVRKLADRVKHQPGLTRLQVIVT